MEHMQAMSLLLPEDATHVAVRSGDWSDASTWAGGRIPGNGAEVHIPEGVAVRYDAVSNATLSMVRVDGALNFATDTDSRMKVDTIFSTPGSTITIGTKADPVDADVDVEIIFNDGPIDLARDPGQFSRGIVAHGEISIHGAEKAAYLALADEPMAGDSEIRVEGDASGWQVGDTLVIMGTHRAGYNNDGTLRTQDEERTITAIDGNTITLDRALKHDHDAPQGFDFDVFVGNQTRNVLLTSENPEGVRGHVMVMHHPEADIRYAEFLELGRTDKSLEFDDVTNVKGRYPLHLHRTGTDADNPAIVVGNAVSGSPGWGLVQHDSAAAIDFNFVYDIAGAGIVSESGNEVGQWIGNFVTGITGTGVKEHGDNSNFGFEGVAYENQGRQIIQQDNMAANSVIGWQFVHPSFLGATPDIDEDDGIILPDRDSVQFDPFPLDGILSNEEPQIMGFIGNTAAVVDVGFFSGKRVAVEKNADLLSQIVEFDVWRADAAVDLTNYTGHYVYKDSDWVELDRGINLARKQSGSSLVNVHFEDVGTAIENPIGLNYGGVLVDLTFKNVATRIESPFADMPLLNSRDLELLDRPVVKIDAKADLSISPNDRRLDITGEIIDSVGARDFASNAWLGTPSSRNAFRQVEDGISETFGNEGDLTFEEAFALHGTYQKPDGSWIMPVWFWITDRYTAEPHPTLIEITLNGFDAAMLKHHRLDAVEAPEAALALVRTEGPASSGVPEAVARVARLYEAALDRDGDVDAAGFNYWVDAVEAGLGYRSAAGFFLESAEFEGRFGDALDPSAPDYLSDAALVDALYASVLERAPDPAGRTYWIGVLEATGDRAGVLSYFAESPENVANTEPLLDRLMETDAGYWEFI